LFSSLPISLSPPYTVSAVVPWVNDDKSGINSAIGKEILDAYFELKTKRSGGNPVPVEQPNKAQ